MLARRDWRVDRPAPMTGVGRMRRPTAGAHSVGFREIRERCPTRRIIEMSRAGSSPTSSSRTRSSCRGGPRRRLRRACPHVWFRARVRRSQPRVHLPRWARTPPLRDIARSPHTVVGQTPRRSPTSAGRQPEHEVAVVYPPVDLARVRKRAIRGRTERRSTTTARCRRRARPCTRSQGGSGASLKTFCGRLEKRPRSSLHRAESSDAHGHEQLLRRANRLRVPANMRFLGERTQSVPDRRFRPTLLHHPEGEEAFGRSTLEVASRSGKACF